jgi:diacylglycerol kinase (ATP)
MRVLLLHNPEAGGRPDNRAELMQLLRSHGHDPTYQSTKRAGWKRALHAKPELIAVCGGDGTVAKVLRSLEKGSPPVAILPGGSANNISCSLGIGTDFANWIAGWEAAVPHPFALPLLRAGNREARIVEAAGVGVFAAVIAAADQDEPRGEAKVALGARAFAAQLRSARARQWHVEVDGERIDAEAIMLEVLNVPRIGPRLDLSPGMTPGTAATVDVVCVPAESRRLLIEAVQDGAAVPAGTLLRRRGREVSFDPGTHEVHVDDALWPPPTGPVRVWCAAAALTLLRPGSA